MGRAAHPLERVMGQHAKSQVVIADFPGLATNADATDLPDGAAQEQVNVSSATPGLLEVRQGFRPVTFEGES